MTRRPTRRSCRPPVLDPGLPRLDEGARLGHPFKCRVYGCLRLVSRMEIPPRRAVGVGYCEDHCPRVIATVPLAIYGREREGWHEWPGSLAAYLLRRNAATTKGSHDEHTFPRLLEASDRPANHLRRRD